MSSSSSSNEHPPEMSEQCRSVEVRRLESMVSEVTGEATYYFLLWTSDSKERERVRESERERERNRHVNSKKRNGKSIKTSSNAVIESAISICYFQLIHACAINFIPCTDK
mmetsp:Transcript_33696/g.72869  ORF Transcript_33696/g.72869 Transcript_33696/m.72869 type:complete len:111 (-) Transcript_33696:2249-2581(-)